MSQVSRQNTKSDVEKDFYKLVNNSSFGYGCQNNADNCFFHPIYDEIKNSCMLKGIKMFFIKT